MALPTPRDVLTARRYRKQAVFEMDDGSDVAVSLADVYINEFELSWTHIDATAYGAIIDEYEDAGGMAETFTWTNPIDSTEYTCRFASEIRNTGRPGDKYNVSVTLKCVEAI